MRYPVECCTCGTIVVLVAEKVFCGNYPCPECQEGLLIIPETKVTPKYDDDGFGIDYLAEIIRPLFDAGADGRVYLANGYKKTR